MKVVTSEGEVVLGTTEAAPTISITDFSRRETDDFGVTTVVPRDFSRRMSVRLALPFEEVDAVQQQLAALRATPAQWIADDRYDWLNVEGFYKDFQIDLNVPPLSYCTLTIEGLAESEPGADPGGDPAPVGSASTLRLLQPVDIATANLVSSNVPENDYPQWAVGATYAQGARVIKTSTHRIYESAANGNIGHDPEALTGHWIEIGATNRWAMFDQALGSVTAAPGNIQATLSVASVDAVVLLDTIGISARVQAPGYDRTIAGETGSILFLDLPLTTGQITVTIAGPAEVGTLLLGRLVELGVTEASPTAGINDFSRKETDDFGEVTVVPRSWSKRMSARALIRSDAVDDVANRIAAVRARPSLWIGDEESESLTIYGFFKDFSIEVGENVSVLTLSVEGLSEATTVGPLTPNWTDIADNDPSRPRPHDGATVGGTLGVDIKNPGPGPMLPVATDIITVIGTAAAIAGQGALATRATVSFGVAGRVLRDDGATQVTDALAVTSLGTAASIAGQGALATLSNVSATRLLIGDVANLVLDPEFKDPSYLSLTAPSAVVTTGAIIAGLNVRAGLTGPVGNGTTTQASAYFAQANAGARFNVTPNAPYACSFRFYVPAGFTGRIRMRVQFRDQAGNATGTTVYVFSTDYRTVAAAAATYAVATANLVAPANAATADISFFQDQPTAINSAGQAMVAMPRVEPVVALGSQFITRADGTTVLSDATVVTSLGTASAIAGQGAFATVSSAAYGSSMLTGFGAMAARSAVWFGTGNGIYEDIGGVDASLPNFKTPLGTAAAISGQGTLATRSNITDGYLAGNLATRLAPHPSNAAYLSMGTLAYSGGQDADPLRPAEGLANITETRTASAIAGQGALATRGWITLGASTNGGLFNQASNTELLDATVITPLGTAAAIAGQGSGATANSLGQLNAPEGAKLGKIAPYAGFGDNLMSTDLTVSSLGLVMVGAMRSGPHGPPLTWQWGILFPAGFADPYFYINDAAYMAVTGPRYWFSCDWYNDGGGPRAVRIGMECNAADGTYVGFTYKDISIPVGGPTRMEDYLDIMAGAAKVALYFQALGNVGYGTYAGNFRVAVTQGNSDNTAKAQIIVTPPPNPTVGLTNGGAVKAGQLPRLVPAPVVSKGGVPITLNNNVSYSIANATNVGAVTVDNANGSATKGQQTIPSSGFVGAGSYDLVVTVDGIVQPYVHVTVNVLADAPPAPAGGKTGSTTISDAVTSVTYVQVGAIINITQGTGETIRCTYTGSYEWFGNSGSRRAQMKWRYSPTGTNTWTDLASPVNGSFATANGNTPGSITCNQNAAPANGGYDIALFAAISSSSLDPLNFDGQLAHVNVGV